MTVAVLGTGQMGAALARAFARAGVPLALGSREPARAEALAVRVRGELPGARVDAADHPGAVRLAEVVVLAIDLGDARSVLVGLGDGLSGKIVVDPTTPWGAQVVPGTSGALELAALLPDGAALVAAWKTTFAGELSVATAGGPHDVLLCGDDASAKAKVAALVRATGFRPLDCGGLEHAATLEGMTRMMGPIARSLGWPAETIPAFRLSAFQPEP